MDGRYPAEAACRRAGARSDLRRGGGNGLLAADMARAAGRARARRARRRRARGRSAVRHRRAPRAAARRVGPRPLLRDAADRRLVLVPAPPGRRGAPGALPRAGPGRGVHAGARPLPAGGRRRMSDPRTAGAAAQDPRRLAGWIAGYASDKKAIDLVELDLRGVLGYTDYFVICSGNTDRQTKAIHDGIHEGLKKEHQLLPRRVEGLSQARWILMDYLDVIVHVFTPEAREYYRLEQLWGEAPRRAVGE